MATFSINGVLQASYRYDYLGRQVSRALTDGVIYYVRTDHIGRPVFATNVAGVKVWTASYLPFGGVRTSTGSAIALRFPGQWFQSESGLHQNWMRDYDPTTSRYIQADPLGLVDGASVYGYARQSPAMFTDPTGQCTICAAAGAGAVIGVAVGFVADQIWGDGCYSLEEGLSDAALGAAYGSLGAVYGIGVGAAGAAGGLTDDIAKGITNQAIPKLPPPIVPNGMTQSQFGREIVQWGQNAEGALARSQTLTSNAVQQMQSQGLTREMAVQWRNFYANELGV